MLGWPKKRNRFILTAKILRLALAEEVKRQILDGVTVMGGSSEGGVGPYGFSG